MESIFLQLCALCFATAVLSAARTVLGRADTSVPTVTRLGSPSRSRSGKAHCFRISLLLCFESFPLLVFHEKALALYGRTARKGVLTPYFFFGGGEGEGVEGSSLPSWGEENAHTPKTAFSWEPETVASSPCPISAVSLT